METKKQQQIQEHTMDFLFESQIWNYRIHKYNMLTQMGAFNTIICKESCKLSPRAIQDNVQAFLK